MSARIARLSYRRPGSTTWIDLDPSTPLGQRLLAGLHITTNPEGNSTMTTTATRLTEPRTGRAPDYIGVPPKEASLMQMGWVLQAKLGAQRLYNRLAGAVRGAWGWIRNTFHLDAAVEPVKDAYHWSTNKAAAAGRFLGTSGGAGLGMLAVSTPTGRRILHALWKPIGWALGRIGALYAWTEASLRNDSKGGLRNWVADRMFNARVWAFGSPNPADNDHGFFGRQAIRVAKAVGPYLQIDSGAMRTMRAIGVVLLAAKLLPLLHLLPVGGTIAYVIGWLIVIEFVASCYEPEIRKITRAVSKKADKAGDTISDIRGEAHQIEADTASAVTADINAAVKATTGVIPVNRASTRAAAKAGTGRRR